MAKFGTMIDFISVTAHRGIDFAMSSSPAFLRYYDMRPGARPGSVDLELKSTEVESWPHILTLLSKLADQNSASIMGILKILDEVEHIMESDHSQRDMITTGMAWQLSEMAAIAQIQDSLSQHQPRLQISDRQDIVTNSVTARLSLVEDLKKHLESVELAKFTKPRLDFEYPRHK